MVILNPAHPESKPVVSIIQTVEVSYLDLQGSIQTGYLEVHPRAVGDITAFFKEALRLAFPIERIAKSSDFAWDDDVLMDKNITSSFNFRLIKGTDTPSLHGRGLALDVNPRLNPYIRFINGVAEVDPPGAEYDITLPGTLYTGHPLVVFLKQRGWDWGGDWTEASGRIDYQHFQKDIIE